MNLEAQLWEQEVAGSNPAAPRNGFGMQETASLAYCRNGSDELLR
jgi:hypothetical protein